MLSERIKLLRLSYSMSQVDLAKKLNVTKQSVSNWENDNIQPSIEMLVNMSKIFSVSTDYLLGLEDHRYIDASGLSDTQIAHIQNIINDIKQKKN